LFVTWNLHVRKGYLFVTPLGLDPGGVACRIYLQEIALVVLEGSSFGAVLAVASCHARMMDLPETATAAWV